MKRMTMLLPALAILLWGIACTSRAEDRAINIDELPHKTIELPNGSKAEVIQFNDHWWRVVDVSVLSSNDDHDPDVCFEAKYDTLVAPDKLKLFGMNITPTPNDPQRLWASIIVDDRLKHRAADFKRSDNLWLCGTLRRSPTLKGLDFYSNEILKQPADAQRFEFRIGVLEKKADFEALIDLGQKILQQTKGEVRDFADYDKLGNLSRRAFESGLTLKEKSIKTDDADGMYELALQWKEKGQRKNKYRDLVEKVLKIRPDHPQAGHDAEGFGLKRFEGKWLGEDEIALILEDRKKKAEIEQKTQQEQMEHERVELARSVEQRASLLLRQQADLRSGDAKARDQALSAFGEAIQKSVDPGFGKESIELLSSLDVKTPVATALSLAARSSLPAVRRCALEAMAWRGTQQEANIYDALSVALRSEKDVTTVKAGVSALVASGGKGAVDTLVASLAATDKSVRDEFIDGLKTVTRQQFNTREEWEGWWKTNKATFNPN